MSTKPETKDDSELADATLSDEQLESVAGGIWVQSSSVQKVAGDPPSESISFNFTKITY
jgi:hypothetical protein